MAFTYSPTKPKPARKKPKKVSSGSSGVKKKKRKASLTRKRSR